MVVIEILRVNTSRDRDRHGDFDYEVLLSQQEGGRSMDASRYWRPHLESWAVYADEQIDIILEYWALV